MKFKTLLENRKSIREYQAKHVEAQLLNTLMGYSNEIKGIVPNIQTKFVLIEKGWEQKEVLRGKAGYSGYPVHAPHYIAFISEEKDGYLENAGYMMEQLIIKAIEMELGTCWLTVDQEGAGLKEDLKITVPGKLVALTSIGYAKKKPLFTKESQSSRMPLRDFVYQGKWGNAPWVEELEMRGLATIFHHIRMAPSWGNRQPWKLIIDRDEILLVVGGQGLEDKNLLIDAGIMMLYMERSFNEEGLMAKWSLYTHELDGEYEEYEIPENYRIVGTLHI